MSIFISTFNPHAQIKELSLQDDDLVVVARAFLKQCKLRPTKEVVVAQIDELGFKPLPTGVSLRKILVHFGQEIESNGCGAQKERWTLVRRCNCLRLLINALTVVWVLE